MSIEITLYPPRATRRELVAFLNSRGFTPAFSSLELSTRNHETIELYWFNSEDYTSFSGVEARVYAVSDEERAKYGPCEWAINTRTTVARSSGDRHQQNETIRVARRAFGGSFYNDWHGKNRYTPEDSQELTPAARGLYIVYERTKQSLKNVKFALPEPPEGFAKLQGTKFESVAQADPTRTLYNGLVPFTVAALEHFFSQAFKILLHYDEKARQRLAQVTRKVDFSDAVALSKKEKLIEDVVADGYSFQSIDSVHKAFNDWFAIDIWKLFRQRRKVGKRIDWLEKRFKALIEFRHGIVHRFELNTSLTKEGIEELLDLSLLLIDVFIDHAETVLKEKIRD